MIGPEQAYTSFDPEYVTQWVSSSTKDAPPVFAKSFRTVFYAGPLARKERRSWIESDVVALDCKIGGGGATAAMTAAAAAAASSLAAAAPIAAASAAVGRLTPARPPASRGRCRHRADPRRGARGHSPFADAAAAACERFS